MKRIVCLIALLFLISCKKEEMVKNEPLKLDYYTETKSVVVCTKPTSGMDGEKPAR